MLIGIQLRTKSNFHQGAGKGAEVRKTAGESDEWMNTPSDQISLSNSASQMQTKRYDLMLLLLNDLLFCCLE
jgi:hypothetical protein